MKLAGLKIVALMLMAASATAPVEAARKPKKTAAPAPVVPSVKNGVELWRAGDYAGAVAMWQPFADGGDMDAMFNIGQAYKLGRAVPKDSLIARDWYRRAAQKGHLPAQANLGILLFQAGEKPEAMRWLKTAADRNEMRAQYVLGVANWNGDGTPRNMTLAYAYLSRAAAQGLPEATTALGNLTASLAPIERANGWAVATSLAAGNGVPPEFAGPGGRATPQATASLDRYSRDQVIKPLPQPVQPAPAAGTVQMLPPQQRSGAVEMLPARPQPVMPAPAPAVAPTPAPAALAQAQIPVAPRPAPVAIPAPVPAPRPAPAAVPTVAPVAAPIRAPAPSAAPPKPIIVAQAPASKPIVPPPVVVAQAKPAPMMVAPVVAPTPAPAPPPPRTVDRPVAPPVTTVAIPASAPSPAPVIPVVIPPKTPAPVAKPVEVAVAAPKPALSAAAKVAPKPAGWRVQLGAFSKKEQAEAAWTEVKAKQKQLVANSKPIYTADGSVTKLQMGPYPSKAAARDACAKIAFSGRACFVTEG